MTETRRAMTRRTDDERREWLSQSWDPMRADGWIVPETEAIIAGEIGIGASLAEAIDDAMDAETK